MSERSGEAPGTHDLPTFSECVVGYRRWHADEHNRLWPLWASRRPWTPGANTARCNCASSASLRFEWSEFDGRRILEPAPPHDAPDQNCECGLYSWRLPRRSWQTDVSRSTPPSVVGAVASWGRMQVHADGFRAEHACVVLLAHHHSVSGEELSRLMEIGELYRVDVVGVEELERRAGEYGSPLPASVMPAPKPLVEPTPRRPPTVPPATPRREDREAEKAEPPWALPAYLGAGLAIVTGLVIAGFWLVQHGTAEPSAAARAHATARTHDVHVPLGITVFLMALGLLVLGAARLLWPIRLYVQDLRLQRHIRRHGVHEAS
jgi:hypothetical protein